MTFDVKILSAINLSAQVLLIIAVCFAAYVAKKKKDFRKHCAIIRVAMSLEILAIVFVMLLSMVGYILHEKKGIFFNTEMYIHHFLGLILVLLWVCINFAVEGRIKLPGRLAIYMRAALSLWILTFLIGLHFYSLILVNK